MSALDDVKSALKVNGAPSSDVKCSCYIPADLNLRVIKILVFLINLKNKCMLN